MSASPKHPRPSASSVREHGGRATLVVRRLLAHSPAAIWKAITDPEEVKLWFLTEAQVEARVGGNVDLVTGRYRVHATGKVLAWDPPHLYEYEWNVAAGQSFPEGERTVIRWELAPQDGGTLVTLTHRDLTKRTARWYGPGVEAFLERLEAQLNGDPLPDWEARVGELRSSAERGA